MRFGCRASTGQYAVILLAFLACYQPLLRSVTGSKYQRNRIRRDRSRSSGEKRGENHPKKNLLLRKCATGCRTVAAGRKLEIEPNVLITQ
jgi:hypothetical protein